MEPPYKNGRLRYHLGQVFMLEEMEWLTNQGHTVSAVVCDPPVVINSRSRPASDSQRATIERFLRAVLPDDVSVLRLSDLCRDAQISDPEKFSEIEDGLLTSFKVTHDAISRLSLSDQARRDLKQYRSKSIAVPPLSLAGALTFLRRSLMLDDQDILSVLYVFTNRPSWFDSHNLAATAAMLSHFEALPAANPGTIMEATRNAYPWLSLIALFHLAQARGELLDLAWPDLCLTENIPNVSGDSHMALSHPDECLFIDESDHDVNVKIAAAQPNAVHHMVELLNSHHDPDGPKMSILDSLRKYRERVRSEGLLASIAPDVPEGADAVHLILRGGGARGIALVGAADALWTHYEFRAFWGTSAGAIVAVLLGAGYQPGEVLTVLEKTPIANLIHTRRIAKYWNLVRHGAFYKHEEVQSWLDSLLSAKIDSSMPIRMKDLPFHTTLFAAQAGVGTITFNSRGEGADTPASFAVRSSMAIPFVFTPTIKDGEKIYDGGLINNFPLRQFQLSGSGGEAFIGILVRSRKRVNPRKRRQRIPIISNVYDIVMGQDEAAIVEQYRDKLVVVDTDPIRSLDFTLSDLEVQYLIAVGRWEATQYLYDHGQVEREECLAVSLAASELREAVVALRSGRWSHVPPNA